MRVIVVLLVSVMSMLLLPSISSLEGKTIDAPSLQSTTIYKANALLPITPQNIDKLKLLKEYRVDDGIRAIEWSQENVLAVSSYNVGTQSHEIWFSTLEDLPVPFVETDAWELKFHPLQPLLASRDGSVISVWNIETTSIVHEMEFPASLGEIYGMDFSPDGTLIAAVDDNNIVRIWATDTGQEVSHLDGVDYGLSSDHFTFASKGLAFHPKAMAIAFCDTQQEVVYLWYFESSEPLVKFEGDEYVYSRAIYEVTFSPEGRWLTYSGHGNTIELWDIQTKLRKTLEGHEINDGGTTGIDFNPDGTLLVAGAWDGTLEFWDVKTSESLFVIDAHSGMVRDTAFNSSGTVLVSASHNGVLRFWGIPAE